MIMCGMSACFSALFGTPMAAAIFSMEVVSVGIMYYAALVPCVISSLVAHGIAVSFGISQELFLIDSFPPSESATPSALRAGNSLRRYQYPVLRDAAPVRSAL